MKKNNNNLIINLKGLKEENPEFPVSLLMSATQKAVRLGLVNQALKCANMWYKNDPTSFLRRIIVIAIEDCLVHPATGKIVALAREYGSKKRRAAMPKEKLQADYQFAMEIVQQLALCPVRDYDGGYVPYLYHKKDINALPTDATGLAKKEAELVESIRKRKTMGGMAGDLFMLEIAARLWTERFRKKQFTVKDIENYFPKPTVKTEEISNEADVSDIPIATIDSHCSGIVPILLKKPHVIAAVKAAWGDIPPEKMETKVKKAIFYRRSWLNGKKDIITGRTFDQFGTIALDHDPIEKENIRRLFEEIAPDVHKLSGWIIWNSLKIGDAK